MGGGGSEWLWGGVWEGRLRAAPLATDCRPEAPFGGGGGVRHKALVSDCLPLAAPIGLLPPLILTLCGPERVLVVSTEPPDDWSCLTTPGVGRPRDLGGGGVVGVLGTAEPHPPRADCTVGVGGPR